MNSKIKDITGQRFGRLEAVKWAGISKNYKSMWLCKCDCGNEKIVIYDSLKKGATKSCGCLWKELHESRTLRRGEANFNQLLYGYKRHAKDRNLSFELTKEEFRILTQQNCYYCGDPPSQSHVSGHGLNGEYIYNGVDRLDSSKGYILDNCVSCCGVCNKMKMNKPNKDFLSHIKQIYENMNLVEFDE